MESIDVHFASQQGRDILEIGCRWRSGPSGDGYYVCEGGVVGKDGYYTSFGDLDGKFMGATLPITTKHVEALRYYDVITADTYYAMKSFLEANRIIPSRP